MNKYLKYKKKYFELKNIINGGLPPRKLDIEFGIKTYQTLGDCIKELIDASFEIYTDLLSKGIKTTIVCGGQSPSYYCLAMMNFSIYNPDLVNIVVLPHSKGGQRSSDQLEENILYYKRLREKGIVLNPNVVLIDGVHSGVGILALQSALYYCYPSISIQKIAINSTKYISQIPVDKTYVLPCEPKFSDTFPRLVQSYYPRFFNDSSKFITELNIDGNPIAEMIIDIATNYPSIQVEDTEWFKQNNKITKSIAKLKEERVEEELKDKEREAKYGTFIRVEAERYAKSFRPNIHFIHSPVLSRTLLVDNDSLDLDFKSKLKPYEFDAKPELKKLQKETKLKQYQQTRPK